MQETLAGDPKEKAAAQTIATPTKISSIILDFAPKLPTGSADSESPDQQEFELEELRIDPKEYERHWERDPMQTVSKQFAIELLLRTFHKVAKRLLKIPDRVHSVSSLEIAIE